LGILLDIDSDHFSEPIGDSPLIKAAINLFTKMFRNPQLTKSNKDQLVNHFLLHTKPSTRKVK